jgi:ribosomal protein S25
MNIREAILKTYDELVQKYPALREVAPRARVEARAEYVKEEHLWKVANESTVTENDFRRALQSGEQSGFKTAFEYIVVLAAKAMNAGGSTGEKSEVPYSNLLEEIDDISPQDDKAEGENRAQNASFEKLLEDIDSVDEEVSSEGVENTSEGSRKHDTIPEQSLHTPGGDHEIRASRLERALQALKGAVIRLHHEKLELLEENRRLKERLKAASEWLIRTETVEKVYKACMEMKVFTPKELREKTGLTNSTIASVLRRLRREGKVRRVVVKGREVRGLYEVSEDGS